MTTNAVEHGKSERQITNELTDLMARLLHYQEAGERTSVDATYEQMQAAWHGELPPEILFRYRNDAKFHAQVTRAVAFTMRVFR